MDASPSKNVSKRNRCYIHGQAVGDDLRSLVVSHIMEAGGNPENKYIPYGVVSRVARSVKLSNHAVKSIWDRFCDSGNVAPRPHESGRKKKTTGTRIIVWTKKRSPHLTLNLMVSLNGIAYANVVEGATDTDRYLNFFHEAGNSVNDVGQPALVAGDIADNCPTHRNRGQLILARYLANQGREYVFLPSYSPDLNPAEFCFRHVKSY